MKGDTMGESFNKIRRGILLNACVRSILYGLSCGIGLTAAVMLVLKLAGVRLNLVYYIIAAVVLSAAACAIWFFALRRSNSRIARELDESMGLAQRVQTMLEFDGAEGGMIELQRRDANERLSAVSDSQFKGRRIWTAVLAFVLAAALLVGAVLVPQRGSQDPFDPDFEMSDFQRRRLEELIEYVKASQMEESVKTRTVSELEGLLVSLESAEKESQKNKLVREVIKNVRSAVDVVCAYDDIGLAMRESGFDNMEMFDTALYELSQSLSSESLEAIKSGFGEYDEMEKLAAASARFSQELQSCLQNFNGNMGITLFAFISAIRREVDEAARNMENLIYGVNVKKACTVLDGIFDRYTEDISAEMQREMGNISTGEYVVNELMTIFNVTDEDGDSSANDGQQSSGTISDDTTIKRDDEDRGDDGGAGTGETLYGSNDIIYDYESKSHVKYGDVIEAYRKGLYEKADGDTSSLSDEEREFILSYISALYGNSKSDD